MADAPRYPGYRTLAKRDTPSWNAITRRVIDERLAAPDAPRFFTNDERAIADALCRRIVPQDGDDEQVSLVALLDAKLYLDQGAGFRDEDMPYQQDAWRHALAAIDADAKDEHDGLGFAAVDDAARDAYLTRMHDGEVDGRHWNGIDPQKFFKRRVLVDVPPLFYGLPKAWDEMGFGGPASPRGYVRLEGNRRDPWEAVEAKPGDQAHAERLNRRVV